MPIKNEEPWAQMPREKIVDLKDKAKTLFNHEARQPGAVHMITLQALMQEAEGLGLIQQVGMEDTGLLHASCARYNHANYNNGGQYGWRADQALGHICNRAARALRIMDSHENCYTPPKRIMYVGYPAALSALWPVMRA